MSKLNSILNRDVSPVEPGIHFGIPFETYLTWPAVSNSSLSLLKRSPAHCKAGFGEPTEAMKIGSLAHCALLEPLQLVKRYVVMPNYANHPENTTKDGSRSYSSATTFVKNKEEEFRKLNHDKEFVAELDYDRMLGMSQAVHSHYALPELLSNTQKEVSVLWWDLEWGCWCKSRFDVFGVSSNRRRVLDVKTTPDCRDFERSIATYGYHRQAALYLRGLRATDRPVDNEFWFAAIETKAPFGIMCAPISDEAIDVGNREVANLVEQFIDCAGQDAWPGYDSPDFWNLPSWYAKPNQESVELLIDGEVLEV